MVVRLLAAVVYVAFFTLPLNLREPDNGQVMVIVFLAAPAVVGALIGRWWAVLLALVQVGSLMLWGDGYNCAEEAARNPLVRCDIDWWGLTLGLYVPVQAVLIAAGWAVRWGLDVWSKQPAVPPRRS
jgi:hypothetical protein